MTPDRSARVRENALLLALALFSAVNVYCWIQIIPLADAPDEPSHFEVVSHELVFRRIPEVGVDDFGARVKIARDGYRSPLYTYSAQPGLSYIISAAAIEILGDRSPESAIYGRYPGILWSALMPLVVFAGVVAMFPGRREAAALAAVCAAFWPQLTFVFSYLNNDGLTALACAALIASWFAGARRGWSLRDALVTGGLTGLVLLNKPNGFPIATMSPIVAMMTMRGGWRSFASRFTAAALAAAVVAGWWYAIAFLRYGADLLAQRRADEILERLGVSWASGRSYGMSLYETAVAPFPRYGESWLEGTLTSAVGRFGELTIPLPDLVYTIVAGLSIVALAGTVVVIGKERRLESRGITGLRIMVFALIPLEVGLALYRSWAFDFQAQGRYLFPVLLAYFALLGVGLAGLNFQSLARRTVGLGSSLVFVLIGSHSFAVTLLDAYRLSLAELVLERPLLGGGWIAAVTGVVLTIVVYWVRSGELAERGSV